MAGPGARLGRGEFAARYEEPNTCATLCDDLSHNGDTPGTRHRANPTNTLS
jgi:hypothetical protein